VSPAQPLLAQRPGLPARCRWLWDFPHSPPPRFHLSYHSQAGLRQHVPPVALSNRQWYRTIPRFAITYASRPRLSTPTNPGRIRLAQGTLRIPANRTLTCFRVTHAGSFASVRSTPPRDDPSPRTERSPTPARSRAQALASVVCFSPVHSRRRST
jgi:hypothetical protein